MVLIGTFWLDPKHVNVYDAHASILIIVLIRLLQNSLVILNFLEERKRFSAGIEFDRMKDRIVIHNLLDFKEKGAIE